MLYIFDLLFFFGLKLPVHVRGYIVANCPPKKDFERWIDLVVKMQKDAHLGLRVRHIICETGEFSLNEYDNISDLGEGAEDIRDSLRHYDLMGKAEIFAEAYPPLEDYELALDKQMEEFLSRKN